jgi:hypothetical protein
LSIFGALQINKSNRTTFRPSFRLFVFSCCMRPLPKLGGSLRAGNDDNDDI